MGIRDERFQNHQLWDRAVQVGNKLAKLETPEDSEDADRLHTLKSVVSLIADLKDGVLDPYLISLQSLTDIATELGRVDAQVTAYAGNRRSGLAGAESHAEKALATVLAIQRTAADEWGAKAARAYREKSDALVSSLETEIETAKDEVQGWKVEVEEIRSTFREAVTNLQAANQELEAEIQQQKTRLDAAIQKHVDSFGEAQQKRQASFDSFLKRAGDTFDERVDDLASRTEKSLGEWAESAEAMLTEIKRQMESSKRMANLVARAGTAGGFEKHAEKQGRLAFRWAIVSVLALVAVSGLGSYVYLVEATDFDLQRSLFKFLIAAPLVALFGYAARQSHQHREVERYNKQVELEVAALGPYLARLSDTDQEAIIEYMALRIFGHLTPPASRGKAEVTGEDVRSLLSKLKRRKTKEESA